MFISSVKLTGLVAALASLSGASAAGQLGFALGVKQPNGACKVQSDYEADFDAISRDSSSKIVRIYDAAECDVTAQMLPAAASKGFQAVLGIWPETDEQYNNGKQAIMTNGERYRDQIHAITVGSEALYRGTYTADALVSRIEDMRNSAPGFRYGTADSWNKYADGTADPVVRVADILLVNAFAYWQGASIDGAVGVFTDDIDQANARIDSAAGGKEIERWVGETGWPSGGTTYQQAVPTTENAERYYREAICPEVASGANVFVFEAFDEPWKPQSIGDDGSAADETQWGVMTADRQDKYSLRC